MKTELVLWKLHILKVFHGGRAFSRFFASFRSSLQSVLRRLEEAAYLPYFFVLFTDFFVVVRKIMPAPLTDIVRGRILALKEQGNSGYVVRKILSGIPVDVSVRAINQLWKKKLIGGSQNAGKIAGAKRRKLKTVRTPEVIRKVKQMVQSDNPRTRWENA